MRSTAGKNVTKQPEVSTKLSTGKWWKEKEKKTEQTGARHRTNVEARQSGITLATQKNI